MKKIPKLSLVGAGPGNPDLITLRGKRVLQQADIVLYDALANDSLLEFAPPHALTKYVGKKAGEHAYRQAEINNLISAYAYRYGHVVRLKGGDPYLYGRGHEEQLHAEANGITVEVIPGVSSVYSVPALQGIPLTQRGISNSFWVLTATTRSGMINQDLHLAAQSDATIVILMGMRKIEQIASIFTNQGKGETPVAVIQNGTLPSEKVGITRIYHLQQMVEKQHLGNPAVIIIGEVVNAKSLSQVLQKAMPGEYSCASSSPPHVGSDEVSSTHHQAI
jgi:uroporphyrin-III C-methyltransferase